MDTADFEAIKKEIPHALYDCLQVDASEGSVVKVNAVDALLMVAEAINHLRASLEEIHSGGAVRSLANTQAAPLADEA